MYLHLVLNKINSAQTINSIKFAFYLLVIVLSSPTFAKVDFTPQQQILMTGESCQELSSLAKSIMSWTNSIYKKKLKKPECFCSASSCHIDVAKISPYSVKELTNFNQRALEQTVFAGPNCYNAALKLTDTLPTINLVHPKEMNAILSSSLCKERQSKEEVLPGDILAVRNQSNKDFEIHAGIYISDELSFSKHGSSKILPFSYMINANKKYGIKNDQCQYIVGTPKPGDWCYNKSYVNIFSCQPLYRFISQTMNQPEEINEDVRSVYADTMSIDSTVSKTAFKGAYISTEKRRNLQNRILTLYDQSEVIIKNISLNKNNKTLIKLMRFRLYSLYLQIRVINKSMTEKIEPSYISEPEINFPD